MRIIQLNYLLLSVLLLSIFCGCAQEKKEIEDPYFEFKKEIYNKVDYPDYHTVIDNCLLKGYVLTMIEIDKHGNASYHLLYSTNSVFKESFFESLKKVDVSSLNNSQNYLVPIVYEMRVAGAIECPSIKEEDGQLIEWLPERFKNRVDYSFEPFRFYGYTPIS